MPAKKSTKTKKKMPKKASVKKVSTKKSAKASKPVAAVILEGTESINLGSIIATLGKRSL